MANPYNILKQSKILCVTSKWEGFGMMIIEALTLGKPIITSKVGGIPEFLTTEEGIFCNSTEEYLNAIQKLKENEKYYQRMSENALARAKALENIEKYIDTIERAYKQ